MNREGKASALAPHKEADLAFGEFVNALTTMANDNGNGKWSWDNGNADQQLLPG